jgi:hypothetical protein
MFTLIGRNGYPIQVTASQLESMTNPLEQFEIRDLFNIDALGDIHFSFTNIILYLTISFFIIILLNILTTKLEKLIYNN